MRVAPTDDLDGWPGFRFGRHDRRREPERRWFAEGLTTDAAGRVSALFRSTIWTSTRPVRPERDATLLDGASRPVERRLTRGLRPTAPVVGIRPNFDGALPEKAQAGFDLALVAPDGSIAAAAS